MTKIKILVIPGYRIFPIDSGGAHGQLTFLEKQQYLYDISIIITPENMKYADMPLFKKRFPELTLVPIGYDLKKQKGIKAFLSKQVKKFSGKDFTYITRKVKHLNGFIINSPLLIEKISEFINSSTFNLIQVEHLRNAGLISILPRHIKRIFILHEVGFLRVNEDLKSLGYSKIYAAYMSGFTEGAEIFWMQQYDGMITFNRDDVQLLERRGVKIPMQVASPFALFDDELNKVYDYRASPKLIFIGGENHYPNEEGLTWFIDNIFPLVLEKNNSISLVVTSKWSEDFKNKHPKIEFTGFIDNLDEVINNAILISPVRIGSGIRVKVFTSMAKGLPIVSTTLGASGIPGLCDGENILLADNEMDFANCVIQLVENEKARKDISEGAFELACKNYAEMRFADERNKFYELILGVKDNG